LKKALGVLMASFPVYRIYPDSYPLNAVAVPVAKEAFEKGAKYIGDAQGELQLLKEVFFADCAQPEDANRLLFLRRLMQFTGPLAAKGVEDTTFYVYNPLISHNEVGDAPAQLGISIQDFHDKMKSRQQNNPYSLNGTSTHDTKRGEDGRMRINVLAEMADEWIEQVKHWREINKPFIKNVGGKPAPSPNDEYFIYQSLIGSFPENLKVDESYIQRSHAFIEKALREAKVETTYTEPNAEYEEACKNFISSLLNEQNEFLKSFVSFLQQVIEYATIYSLEQVLVKITAPGIPDVYQGCDLWI
jgi:(1->4)-alpha-D-glucan 1-alpha-D-glucosylmutase